MRCHQSANRLSIAAFREDDLDGRKIGPRLGRPCSERVGQAVWFGGLNSLSWDTLKFAYFLLQYCAEWLMSCVALFSRKRFLPSFAVMAIAGSADSRKLNRSLLKRTFVAINDVLHKELGRAVFPLILSFTNPSPRAWRIASLT